MGRISNKIASEADQKIRDEFFKSCAATWHSVIYIYIYIYFDDEKLDYHLTPRLN